MNFLLTHSPLLYLAQSIWRDEGFSLLFASQSLGQIWQRWGMEPPIYYFLLHVWLKIFGINDIAARTLSSVGFLLACFIMIIWSEKLFKKHWLSWFTPLFFFINPMLLYYAFEIRTYGWFMFFAILSMYAFYGRKKKLYIISTLLGIYTHSYMLLVPMTQAVYFFLTHIKTLKKLTRIRILNNPTIKSFIIIFIGSIPLIYRSWLQLGKFKDSWYYPVDFHLVKSVLGNMFIGYEGTPWYLWSATTILSLLLLGSFVFTLFFKKHRHITTYLFTIIVVPLVLVIGISFIKPLFVNRYLIPVSIAEIILFCYSLYLIKNSAIAKVLGALAFIIICGFNVWYPSQHQKTDFRTPLTLINALQKPNDLIYAENPLILFETLIYAKNKNSVFLYNPTHAPFPWYIGDAVVTPKMFTSFVPIYPNKAYLVHIDGTFSVISSYPDVSVNHKGAQ